jgi:hypothetical protein
MEIMKALQRRIRVIPVLVGEATMPEATHLPPDLAGLSRRHGIEISACGTPRLGSTRSSSATMCPPSLPWRWS